MEWLVHLNEEKVIGERKTLLFVKHWIDFVVGVVEEGIDDGVGSNEEVNSWRFHLCASISVLIRI